MVEDVGPGKLLSHFSLILCGTRQNGREELTTELTSQGLVVTGVTGTGSRGYSLSRELSMPAFLYSVHLF